MGMAGGRARQGRGRPPALGYQLEAARMILDTIERFLVWTVRKLGSLTVIRLGLLALALANVGWGLNRVIGKVSSGPLVTVALVAMLTGWFFGRTRLKGWLSALILILIGVIYLALTSGRLWN